MDHKIINDIREKLGNRQLKLFEKNPQRYYIDISPRDIVESCRILFRDLRCRFVTATGIDTREGTELLYHFSHDITGKMLTLKVTIKDRKKPEIDSIAGIIKGAEWIEREIWEMLGVNFKGHPNLKHLLLAEDWPEGKYPQRQANKEN